MAINNKKLNALSFISMLVVSIFAFGYLIGGEIKTVSAADSYGDTFTIGSTSYSGGEILWQNGKFNYYDASGKLVGNGGASLSDPIQALTQNAAATLPTTGLPTNFNPSAANRYVSTDGSYYLNYLSKTYEYNSKYGWAETNSQVQFSSAGSGDSAFLLSSPAAPFSSAGTSTPANLNGLPSGLSQAQTLQGTAVYGNDYVYTSPSTSSNYLWSSNENKWVEVPQELYTDKIPTRTFKSSDISSDIQVEITDAAPSPISAAPTNTQPATDLGAYPANDPAVQKALAERTAAEVAAKAAASDRGTMTVWGIENVPFGWGQLAQGLTWSLAAVAAIQTLGGVFGMDKEETNALSAAATVGIMAGKMSYALLGKGGAGGFLSQKSWLGQKSFFGMGGQGATGKVLSSPAFSAGVAIVAAWLTYNAMYKKENTETQTVNFQCLPWQAPRGGSDCELCNDGGLPCSEYRCKSLGQSCKLINEGTAVEKCINANPRDVSPPVISPWTQILTSGYRYEGKSSPPGPGVKIIANTSNGCLRAFQAIQFGVVTNEPSQCKIDIASTKNYSDMATYMGGDNLYTYNHSEVLSLPKAADFANTSITLENGKEMNLFVRCKDANGNLNSAEYVVNVCVDPTPDNTAPEIKATSIKSGNCVAANTDNTSVEFYTNEPSTCKWSFTDKDYSIMDYNMSCSTNIYEINAMQLYTCSALLTGIARDGTNYYVKCEDQPNAPVNERNKNVESYQFSLKGSNPLKLLSIKPNQTIYGAVRPTPVELYTQTLYGCEDNKAVCFYSLENANNYVQFYDTDKVDGIHTQRLDLQDGLHTVYVKCVDAGGNLAENTTSFNLEIDTNSPIVARVYQEDTYLKIVTQRNSECVYTNTNCDYLFQEGTTMPYANTTTHVTQWFSDKSYYIKCRDEFRNEPTDCSTIVRPTDNFL